MGPNGRDMKNLKETAQNEYFTFKIPLPAMTRLLKYNQVLSDSYGSNSSHDVGHRYNLLQVTVPTEI